MVHVSIYRFIQIRSLLEHDSRTASEASSLLVKLERWASTCLAWSYPIIYNVRCWTNTTIYVLCSSLLNSTLVLTFSSALKQNFSLSICDGSISNCLIRLSLHGPVYERLASSVKHYSLRLEALSVCCWWRLLLESAQLYATDRSPFRLIPLSIRDLLQVKLERGCVRKIRRRVYTVCERTCTCTHTHRQYRQTKSPLSTYPGLPIFFNVTREKSGRSGRSVHMIGHGLGCGIRYAVCIVPPSQYYTRLIYSSTVYCASETTHQSLYSKPLNQESR